MSQKEMNVLKRNGSYEPILFDKILNRIKKQGKIIPKSKWYLAYIKKYGKENFKKEYRFQEEIKPNKKLIP
jgi:hypothetical protein